MNEAAAASPGPPPDGLSPSAIPEARIEPLPRTWPQWWLERSGWRYTRMWWITAAALVLAVVLAASAWRSPGPIVTIEFDQGYGIQPGDAVRLRGIAVGQVEHVVLNESLDRVRVTARLMRESAPLARDGTMFWIERPQVSLGNIRGLDTVVGPKYVGVRPGPDGGRPRFQFQGVEAPRQLLDDAKKLLTLTFRQGHGIQVGSPVRFRGVKVGEVVHLGLSVAGTEVLVAVELISGAAGLAREGAQYWIERPQLGVADVRGLETMVTGPYLAVMPGPTDGLPVEQLPGLDVPPVEADAIGGIEVTLESSQRHGLQTGSPVLYRGVAIGRVVHVGLASDAAGVETRVYIEPAYREVVRDNSKFWPISGVDVRLGLTGLTFDSESLATIAAGGLAMATPDEPGRTVAAGHRFRLEPEMESSWLEWRPHLPVGTRVLPDHAPLAAGLRGTFSWRQRSWGISRSRQQPTWLHALEGDRVLCALALDDPDSVPADLKLEFEGQVVEVKPEWLQLRGAMAVVSQTHVPPGTHVWDSERVRQPTRPEDCVLVAGTQSLAVAAARIQQGTTWALDDSLPLSSDWHGASVVARSDAALIGLVIWKDGVASIAPWDFRPTDSSDGSAAASGTR